MIDIFIINIHYKYCAILLIYYKFQSSISKFQINSNIQLPINNQIFLKIDYWELNIICYLVLVIWILCDRQQVTSRFYSILHDDA